MSVETEAVSELYQITFDGVKYTFKILSYAVHGAVGALGVIRAIADGDKRTKGYAKMATLIKQKQGIVSFVLSEEEYNTLRSQMKKSSVLYSATKAEGEENDLVTVFVGREDAHRVNSIIAANHLHKLDESELTPDDEAPEATTDSKAAEAAEPAKEGSTVSDDIKQNNADVFNDMLKEDEKPADPTQAAVPPKETPAPPSPEVSESESKKSSTPMTTSSIEKKSVRERVEEIKRGVIAQENMPVEISTGKQKEVDNFLSTIK